MRASSRPRNENYSAPPSARALNTSTFGSRSNAPSSSVAAPAHSRQTRRALSSERSASPRPRATTPSASPAPTPQGGAHPSRSNPFVSTFHANYTPTTSSGDQRGILQGKENAAPAAGFSHTAPRGGVTSSKPNATTKNAISSSNLYSRGSDHHHRRGGREADDEYRKYQQNFSLSPEGVVEFKPVSRPSNEQYMNEEEDEEDYATLPKGRRSRVFQNANASTLISDTSTLTATTIAAASPLHIANKVIKATSSNGDNKINHDNNFNSTFSQRRIAFEGADSDDDDDYGFGESLTHKPSTISKNAMATRIKASESLAGQERGGVSSSDRLLTSEQIKELLDENDKLRFIEREFWVLLGEREALQDEVEALRKAKDQLHMGSPSAPASSPHSGVVSLPAIAVDKRSQRVEAILEKHGGGGAPAGRGINYSTLGATTINGEHLAAEGEKDLSRARAEAARLKLENESLQIALHECMDIMISEEVQNSATNTIKRDGPVSVYLAWLRSKHEKGEAATALEVARQELGGVASSLLNNHAHPSDTNNNNNVRSTARDDEPFARGRGGPATDRNTFKALTFELEQSHAQVRALQQELDRTDLSRRQALEDCEHMRGQVEALSSQLQQTLASYREAQRALLKYQVDGEQHVNQQQHLALTSPLHNSTARGDRPAVADTTNSDFTAVLSAQLAHKNAEIHQARARMARLQREREAESLALANDTLRIQRELSTRRSQSAPRTSPHANPSFLRSASPPQHYTSSNYNNDNNNNNKGIQSIITDATTILMADDEL